MRIPRCPRSNKRKKKEDKRGRHTKLQRLLRIREAKSTIQNPKCRECKSDLDPMCKTEEGDAIVCTNCGLVDNNTCFDFESPVYDYVPRSPFYKHKNYFAERLLQARNSEPRLSEKELFVLSTVYDTFRDNSPLVWGERNFTKKHCGIICRLIKKKYPNSPFNRRIERWYQYRVYICGSTNTELPLQVANQLRYLFDAYSEFFTQHITNTGESRKNITQLDLVILILLYSIDYKLVQRHGWYFLNHNIVNKTPSVYRDRDTIKQICMLVNSNILNYQSLNIKPNCYKWFRSGRRLKIPSIDKLLDMCLSSEMGVIQYLNYKKDNEVALLYYLDKINNPPTIELVG